MYGGYLIEAEVFGKGIDMWCPLPKDYMCSNRCHKYFYDRATKIFNVVRKSVTFNSVVLILADIEKVFCILLTKQYVTNLRINEEHTKRIFFNDENEFDDDRLIKEILFISAGTPEYFIQRSSFIGDIWRLRAEKIEKNGSVNIFRCS